MQQLPTQYVKSSSSRHSTFGRLNERFSTAMQERSRPERFNEALEEEMFDSGEYGDECFLNSLVGEDLEFLAHFIQGTAFYAETLESYLGEALEDFWQAREHAFHIITSFLIRNIRVDDDEEYDEY